MKTCFNCKQEKHLSEFHKDITNKDGHGGTCKTCVAEYKKIYNASPENRKRRNKRLRKWTKLAKSKDARRALDRLKKYGLTQDAHAELLKNQNYKCAVCGATKENSLGNVLHVDHCHKTGKVRGLLCDRCNKGLGMMRDSIVNIKSLVVYLEKHL